MLLAFADPATARPALLKAAEGRSPALPLMALRALDELDGPDMADEVFKRWHALRPRVRSEAIDLLLKRQKGALRMLSAIGDGRVKADDLSVLQQRTLRSHADAEIKALASKLLPTSSQSRDAV